jgi:hypothetical protein
LSELDAAQLDEEERIGSRAPVSASEQLKITKLETVLV